MQAPDGGPPAAEDPVVRALRLRRAVIEALTWDDRAKLRSSVKTLCQMEMTVAALSESGVAKLLNDPSLDQYLGPVAAHRAAAVEKWKALNVEYPVRKRARSPVGAALQRRWRSDTFREQVQAMREYLGRVDGQCPGVVHREAAAQLVLHGFSSPRDLEGLTVGEAVSLVTKLDEVALVRRAVGSLVTKNAVSQAKQIAEASAPPLGVPGSSCGALSNDATRPRSVRVVTAHLTAEHLEEKIKAWVADLESVGIHDGGIEAFPRGMARAVGAAVRSGSWTLDTLDKGVDILRSSSQKRSLPSVVAGIRCWGAFANEVLRYASDDDIPPKSSQDAQRWLTIFRNARTAANYLGYLRWACKAFSVSRAWDDDALQVIVRGLRVRSFDLIGEAMPVRWRLTSGVVRQVVEIADALGGFPVGFAECTALSWDFLLRVRSEAIGLERGHAGEILSIPPSRHSCVYVDSAGVLIVGLRRRKHRPRGSVLKRSCCCKARGAMLCGPHRVGPYLETVAQGAKLWQFTTAEFLRHLRRALGLLGIVHSGQYTLKAFRAGHAAEIASSGASWADVLAAGEWRSLAALAYVDADAVDAAAAAWESVQNSSSGEED